MANLKTLQLPTDVEPMQSFSPLEAGRYEVIITDSELKDTKAGTGQYLQFTFEVVGEKSTGRKLWSRLNLANPNKTAEEIAHRELAAICQATKVEYPPEDSENLHNIVLFVDVVQEKNPVNDSMTNRIKGYAPAELFEPAAKAPPKAASAAPARPWAKK